MRIQPRDFPSHLKQRFTSISPVYFIFGDEPFQRMEAVDHLRASARDQGYTEIEVLELFGPKDEDRLWTVVNTPSLFSEKRLIECRLKEGKITKHTQEILTKVIHQILNTPNNTKNIVNDVLLILHPDKLETSDLKSAWFLEIERMAMTLSALFIPKHKYIGWLSERASVLNLALTPEALYFLCERTEGNLLAAAQVLEKIKLIYAPASADSTPAPLPPLRPVSLLTPSDIAPVMTWEARYSVFDLVDALLQGAYDRTFRILRSLKNEGIEATLVCWAITREVRGLIPLIEARTTGHPFNDALMASCGIWKQRQNFVTTFLKRHSQSSIYDILSLSQHVDTIIKTGGTYKAWNSLIDLCFLCCSGENNGG